MDVWIIYGFTLIINIYNTCLLVINNLNEFDKKKTNNFLILFRYTLKFFKLFINQDYLRINIYIYEDLWSIKPKK